MSEINVKCKHCQSDNVIKWGKYKDEQRYYCHNCQRKFKADDCLLNMKTPANQVSSALNMYYEGMSIKAIRRNLQQEHGNMPSTATIYGWIQKYTQYAKDSIRQYKPQPHKVGNTWIADETVIEIDGENVWLWDIIDDKTRYILATKLTQTRTSRDAQALMDKAKLAAGKEPKKVITDHLHAYIDVYYGKDADHIRSKPFAVEDNTQKIERFHSTLKTRTKVMRGLKNIESAIDFIDGWLVHYNYLRPHSSLNDKTPAESAGADFPYKNWADITRHQPSKPITVEHRPRTAPRLEHITVGRPKKRTRVKYPKINTMGLRDVGMGIERKRSGRGHIKLW